MSGGNGDIEREPVVNVMMDSAFLSALGRRDAQAVAQRVVQYIITARPGVDITIDIGVKATVKGPASGKPLRRVILPGE